MWAARSRLGRAGRWRAHTTVVYFDEGAGLARDLLDHSCRLAFEGLDRRWEQTPKAQGLALQCRERGAAIADRIVEKVASMSCHAGNLPCSVARPYRLTPLDRNHPA